jgi:hypothetical protein
LWNGSANLGGNATPRLTAFRHIAVTFQKSTSSVVLYIDGIEIVRTSVNGAEDATVFAIGGMATIPSLNATGEKFGDILLYRAPLSAFNIRDTFEGRTTWRSIEAWLPLTYSPGRQSLSLAPTVVNTVVHGSWEWSSEATPRFATDQPRAQPPRTRP